MTLAVQPVRVSRGTAKDDAPAITMEVVVHTGVRDSLDEWVEREQGKHFCACGCGEAIKILPSHHAPSKRGIPRYIHTHNVSPMEEIVAGIAAEGLMTSGMAVEALGIGTTSWYRYIARGLISGEARTYGKRQITVFRREDVEALRPRRKSS